MTKAPQSATVIDHAPSRAVYCYRQGRQKTNDFFAQNTRELVEDMMTGSPTYIPTPPGISIVSRLRQERVTTSCIICSLVLFASSAAWAKQHKQCATLFKASRFLQAASCYLNQEKQLKSSTSNDVTLQRDRLLRNAAFCYHHAAKRETRISHKGYLRTKAVALLVHSFRKGYCEASDRCRTNRALADRFRRQIGYANVAIVTGDPKASVMVKGYRYHKTQRGSFTQTLRPGQYRVTIQSPGKQTKRHVLQVQPRRPLTLDASKARVKVITKRVRIASRTPVLVYIGYITGGVLLAGGIGFAAYGIAEQQRLNDIFNDPIKARDITDQEYRAGSKQANSLRITGFVLGGLGVVSLVGAAIVQITSRKQRTPPPTDAAREPRTLSTFEVTP